MDRKKPIAERKSTGEPKTGSKPSSHPKSVSGTELEPDIQEFWDVGGSPLPGITLRRVLKGHSGPVHCIAWSPDGLYLASPSADRTIRIWDIEDGRCDVFHQPEGVVNCVAWSPDGALLASGGRSAGTVKVWDVKNKTVLRILRSQRSTQGSVFHVAWSPRDARVAFCTHFSSEVWDASNGSLVGILDDSGATQRSIQWSPDGSAIAVCAQSTVEVFDARTTQKIYEFINKNNKIILSVAWSPSGEAIATCGHDMAVTIWSVQKRSATDVLESHTDRVTNVSFSPDGRLLASKSVDNSVSIWLTSQYDKRFELFETSNNNDLCGLQFHPALPRLASLGDGGRVVRVWDLDAGALLANQPVAGSVRYTTAKIVLVGDPGVGKTGLGWRLARGEFKEHPSSHGQTFWVVKELGTVRDDGTECEAVLWDLAGQHVYRPIHSIFLDNLDASMVLFDPSNRQDPLKGAQFWFEQLRGRGELPPTVLVGARVDRGAPVLSRSELEQFCQRNGVSGGYISTSAKSGEGLEQLLETLKSQIPWEQMTTTVTSVTFKRVKEHVLALRETAHREGVLVRPEQLHQRLLATDPDWQLNDSEMMTSVRHLDNHGYVTLLRSSSGEVHVLLSPELLVDLASSIALQADKHPQELGAVNETELLQGKYSFDELKGLSDADQSILLDAAVQRFLEHSICFRETLGSGDTLLIFPGLIKQKRPLFDDFEAVDDVSYVVRGRVENTYAALVVLLGYTIKFKRVNQWHNQALYEMRPGEHCGFRLFEEREGEIELLLYYSPTMPTYGRSLFQGLFESLLYQREVEVTRFPPVDCCNGHRQQRVTVVQLLREGERHIYCHKCGAAVTLPRNETPTALGATDSRDVQRAEARARLRSKYEEHLARIKFSRRDRVAPRCFLSTASAHHDWAAHLAHDLRDAGVLVLGDRAMLQPQDYILVLGTPAYKKAWEGGVESPAADMSLILPRLSSSLVGHPTVIPLLIEGDRLAALPDQLSRCHPGDFRDETRYPISLLELVASLYALNLNHPAVEPLRKSLQDQWERTLKAATPGDLIGAPLVSGTGGIKPGECKTPEEKPMSERYTNFDLHIARDGQVKASSAEGEAKAQISTEVPEDLSLALSLIKERKTNSKLLKDVGKRLYEWLLPGPIHAHFQQTETRARFEKAKLRLRFRTDVASIATLPLEFMYRELGGYFLAANPDTVFSRYLDLPLPPNRVRRRDGPLHLLAIVADPVDQTRLPPDEWEELIKNCLKNPLDEGRMTMQMVKRATFREIRDALLGQNPDMIQFVGHGMYEGDQGYLALVDERTGRTWEVDDETFANLFLGSQDHLGLISLATCESALSDDPQGFLGIAPKLVQRGVPAVVAMQYTVFVDTAKNFLENFYASVAARKPIDWATQSARNAISITSGLNQREFATPVLFMRAADGDVF